MSCQVAGYSRPCSREANHNDPVSQGKIENSEVLCRAGYSIHNKKGNPHISLIRANELASGQLSVWRISPGSSSEVSEVVNILRQRGPEGKPLFWVFGVPAERLRNLLEGPICAVDDTDCGTDRHPRHAVLAGCIMLSFQNLALDDLSSDPAFLALRRALLEVFTRSQIWEAETV